MCGAGDPTTRNGLAMHVYACNASMIDRSFDDADGDLLIGNISTSLITVSLLFSSTTTRRSDDYDRIRSDTRRTA